jgi:hypothetical protein
MVFVYLNSALHISLIDIGIFFISSGLLDFTLLNFTKLKLKNVISWGHYRLDIVPPLRSHSLYSDQENDLKTYKNVSIYKR